MKPLSSKPLVAGTVQVNLNGDRTELIGICPTCGSRLSVEVRGDGSFGKLVACMRCKEIYRVEPKGEPATQQEHPMGFDVLYAVEGRWDVSLIMEFLFDNVGTVNPVKDGFVCNPDESHADFPTITVNEHARTVRFGLFGKYVEREAGAIINQVVSEFGTKFQVDLRPLVLERWEYREDSKGFALVERRPLGTLLRERVRKQAVS
jgi:hypothetical protein